MAGDEGLDRDVMVEVWRLAARIVADRPWLLVSWLDGTANIPHVVVHDGPLGAALHFDDEEGPYWSGGFTRRLTWEQVASRPEPEEWASAWGGPDADRPESIRSDAYALIAALHARWLFDIHEWDARPAPILGEVTSTVFDLEGLFPTASDAVQTHLDHISEELERSEEAGQPAYWHEPFWLARRDGEPRLLIDESGTMHLAVTSVHEGTRINAPSGMAIDQIIARSKSAADLAASGYSIDLASAIPRVGGVHELADLCDRGVAAVIFALELTNSGEDGDVTHDGSVPPAPDRSHWGWDYGHGDYVLAWLDRAKDPDALAAWHTQEEGRRRRITALREYSHSQAQAPALVIEALANDPNDPLELTDDRLEDAVSRHIQFHLLPAPPDSMVPACIKALEHVKQGRHDTLIALPEGVTYADAAGSPVANAAPAHEVIRQHALTNFLRPADAAVDVWDLARALDAWDEADRGDWEIPSPAPTWPEYVTLLLVGRNHLMPGADDDPSERDMLSSWWAPETGDWDRMHDESWWTIETTEVMNLPDTDLIAPDELTLLVENDMDPLEIRWIDLMADLVAAKSGQAPTHAWGVAITEILGRVQDAGSFGYYDLADLESAFVAASGDLFTTVIAREAVVADFADFVDMVATSITSVGMGYGWSLPEGLCVDYAWIDIEAGRADLSVTYVSRTDDDLGDVDDGGEARLELFRAGSRVLLRVTEDVPAGIAADPSGGRNRWLPGVSRSVLRSERWAEHLSGLHQWYFHMANDLSGPRTGDHRSDDYLVPVRREVDRAMTYARTGQFADAEIVLESTFGGWVEATPELVSLKLSAEAELPVLMGREDDAVERYRQLVDLLGGRADPARLIKISLRALALPLDGRERSAWAGFALRVIAFIASWHPDAPTWRREVDRLSSLKPARDDPPPVWRESSLTPRWDAQVGAPSLIVVVGSELSRGAESPTRAHSALARLERRLGDEMLVIAGGNDDLLHLAGLRRIVQLGRGASPRQLDYVTLDVRDAGLGCRRLVVIGVSDIDGWTAAHRAFSPKSELSVISSSDRRRLEEAVTTWVSQELSALAYGDAMREEDEARRRMGDL